MQARLTAYGSARVFCLLTVHRCQKFGDPGLNIPGLLIERVHPSHRCRSRPPNQSKRLTSIVLSVLDHCAHFHPAILHIRITLEPEVLPLERYRVVQQEPRSVFESFWDSAQAEVSMKGTRNIGEDEGNPVVHGVGKDGGQNGKCRVQTASAAWTIPLARTRTVVMESI